MDENGATKSSPPNSSNRGKRWTLNGTTALVTGGTKGIGRAIVEALSSFGATVYTCSRNEVELNRCLQEWQTLGFHVMGSVCDISSRAAREELMKAVSSTFNGKLNILINNAGTIVESATVEFTAEMYSFQMATNLESAFHLSQLAHPLLKALEEQQQGNIIFISSISGIIGLQGASVYAASKGAINQLTRALACEWAKDNIRVNCIAPGFIKTPLVQSRIILSVKTELWKLLATLSVASVNPRKWPRSLCFSVCPLLLTLLVKLFVLMVEGLCPVNPTKHLQSSRS